MPFYFYMENTTEIPISTKIFSAKEAIEIETQFKLVENANWKSESETWVHLLDLVDVMCNDARSIAFDPEYGSFERTN